MRHYFVYILRCSDGSYYTGITNDFENRLCEHEAGEDPGCNTFKRRPAELAYVEDFQVVTDAIAWEKQVKGWSRRKRKP
jgi:putative endonuclease